MEFQNPSRECDGNCGVCPRNEVCAFSRKPSMRYSRNSGSGNELELRFSDSMRGAKIRGSYANQYNTEVYSKGFSNPVNREGYVSGTSSSGFHGSYDANGGDYSKMSPKAGKSNYCAGCGKK